MTGDHKLSAADNRHLRAAEGWLELGNWREAKAELEHISEESRENCGVLVMRCRIHAESKQWDAVVEIGRAICRIAPEYAFGWVQTAQGFYFMKRFSEAREVLQSVSEKFKEDWNVHYDLACYECQLGENEAARERLERVFKMEPHARSLALKDEDLRPLWAEIRED